MFNNDMEKKGGKKWWDECKTIFHKLEVLLVFCLSLHIPSTTVPVQAEPSLGLGGEQASKFPCVCSK